MIDDRELRYGVNRWLEAGIITGDQVARILAFENAADCASPPPEPATHTSLVALFQDIRFHVRQSPGARVVSEDDPRARQLGWVVSTTEGQHVQFTIALTRAKASTTEMPADHPFRVLLKDSAGRSQIAERLMDPATELL